MTGIKPCCAYAKKRASKTNSLSLFPTQLLAVSSYTVLSILITSFFYHTRSLAPKTSIWLTASSTGLWILSLGLLSWNLSTVLGATCDIEHWDHDTGIMVCRIYKALESFTAVGTYVFTLLSLSLFPLPSYLQS